MFIWVAAVSPLSFPWQSAANSARELVIQRLIFVGKACENEEQRLLEEVHAEEERAQQSILTQRAHWTEALQKLSALRTYLVDMITNLDDQGLVVSAPPPTKGRSGCPETASVFHHGCSDLIMVFIGLCSDSRQLELGFG